MHKTVVDKNVKQHLKACYFEFDFYIMSNRFK